MAGRQLSDRDQGSATLGPARTRISERLIVAGTATIAFLCYYATLLPGLDLGDSASFQTGVGSLTLTPRQGYPLYYGLGHLFVRLHPGEPARALNLASAIYGALAVGVVTRVASRLTESPLGGAAAGLFLAFSYTFWSQAVTAEVYTLHLLSTGAALVALLSWAERPTVPRLALFYASYALGFGNHLSMILLLPGFALFLVLHRRSGPADPLRPAMIAMAGGIAGAAALQYVWNLRGLWTSLDPPASRTAALLQFWFDVTKADWRETLVMNVSETGLQSRPAMYWFDVRQQFGVPGVVLAIIGLCYLLKTQPRRGGVLVLLYAANLAFAWTYNVGDAYIFFLPAHYMLALCAGAGTVAILAVLPRPAGRATAAAVGALCLLYPAWRGYDTFPAVDRSQDRRAETLLDEFTAGEGVYGVDANWQVQNAFEYFMGRHRPHVPWFTTAELQWLHQDRAAAGLEAFLAANAEVRRDVIVTPSTLARLTPAGPANRARLDDRAPSFADDVRTVRQGTPYALAILRPDREYPLDETALARAWEWVTPTPRPIFRNFTIVVGRVGMPAAAIRSEDRPFRLRAVVASFEVDARMESWLPTDTIRRAGFGHVIVDRAHRLTLERGVSFVTLTPESRPLYSSGIFAPIPRHILGIPGRP